MDGQHLRSQTAIWDCYCRAWPAPEASVEVFREFLTVFVGEVRHPDKLKLREDPIRHPRSFMIIKYFQNIRIFYRLNGTLSTHSVQRTYMKSIIASAILLFAISSMAKDVYVKGHYTKSGTWVEAHHRSAPNNTDRDNYSTKGNTNPYTGEEGTKEPNTYNSSSRRENSSSNCTPRYTCVNGQFSNGVWIPGRCGTVCD